MTGTANVFDPEGMSVCSYCLGVVPVAYSEIDRLTGQPALHFAADWWDAHNPGCIFNEPLPQECPF